ncbi:MAG: SMP-30/gluconolactonase/LRE family protein, partial [Prolixibacteraceae bacterium]|nr:SMP-30/gluconolactonase/LRE family protein [Prolixibacteraceae bacterium]
MKKILSVFILIIYTTINNTQAQECSVIAKNAVVEKAGSDFGFTEGPAVASDGRVFFTDQPNDRIYIWDEKKGISLYKEGVRRSNGLYFNRKGQLIACADEKNQLIYFDKDK